MLMILSALVSGLISQLPSLIALLKGAQDHKNQVELLKLQGQLNIQAADHAALVTALQSSTAERESVRNADNAIPYSGFLLWSKAAIRPLITYMFLGLWLAVKISFFIHYYNTMTWIDTVRTVLWDQETKDTFSTIIALWMGGRFGEKYFDKILPDKPKS